MNAAQKTFDFLLHVLKADCGICHSRSPGSQEGNNGSRRNSSSSRSISRVVGGAGVGLAVGVGVRVGGIGGGQLQQKDVWLASVKEWIHLGGCQNYGPFLGPYYSTAPNI